MKFDFEPTLALRPLGGWRWLWAAPWSLLGLALALPALLTGARARRVGRTLEVSGGWFAHALANHALFAVQAITLGHVVVGRDRATLARLRRHEQAHVRQYEQWGPLFVPAYLLCSAWQLLRGRHPYSDNRFERQAVAIELARLGARGASPAQPPPWRPGASQVATGANPVAHSGWGVQPAPASASPKPAYTLMSELLLKAKPAARLRARQRASQRAMRLSMLEAVAHSQGQTGWRYSPQPQGKAAEFRPAPLPVVIKPASRRVTRAKRTPRVEPRLTA